jgi:hypothetical protein
MELEDLPWVGRLVLAEASGIETSLTAANELAIRRAFEAAGVEFTNGDPAGLTPHPNRCSATPGAWRPVEDASWREHWLRQANHQKTMTSIRVTRGFRRTMTSRNFASTVAAGARLDVAPVLVMNVC